MPWHVFSKANGIPGLGVEAAVDVDKFAGPGSLDDASADFPESAVIWYTSSAAKGLLMSSEICSDVFGQGDIPDFIMIKRDQSTFTGWGLKAPCIYLA